MKYRIYVAAIAVDMSVTKIALEIILNFFPQDTFEYIYIY